MFATRKPSVVVTGSLKAQAAHNRKVEAAARQWLANGHAPEKVATGIWNRFGCFADVRGQQLVIWNIVTIELGA
jgi:hypothetical protein